MTPRIALKSPAKPESKRDHGPPSAERVHEPGPLAFAFALGGMETEAAATTPQPRRGYFESPVQPKCAPCDELGIVCQCKSAPGAGHDSLQAPLPVTAVPSSGGAPIPQATRILFEPQFGRDFWQGSAAQGQVNQPGRQGSPAGQSSRASAPAADPRQAVEAQGRMNIENLFGVHRVAADGTSGSGDPVPHLDRIQQSFGGAHDVSQVRAHIGGSAAKASEQLQANAYATGNDIAFTSQPDLHTAAHEAAHVVQQRAGVQLQGGVGTPGDAYEQQADAVADRVVQGQSAGDLLGNTGGAAVQRSDRAVQKQSTGAFAALTLSEIRCIVPDDLTGDEVYITVNGARVWGPVSMDTGVQTINVSVNFASSPLVVAVFDKDLVSGDDEIGSVTLQVPSSEQDISQAPRDAMLSTSGIYRLFFQVHRV